MREVVPHVVAAERQHRHRIPAKFAHRPGSRCRPFRRHRRTDERAMLPVERLIDERHRRRASAAEENRRDGHPCGVLPIRINDRALRGRCRVSRIRMRRGLLIAGMPLFAQPTRQRRRRFIRLLFPPDIGVGGEGSVREDGIRCQRVHRVRVGVHRGAGSNPEETGFGVDSVESAIFPKFHPSDVVTDTLRLPSRNRWREHGEVRLATRTRKRRGDVSLLAFRARQSDDEHVFRHPPIIFRHDRRDAERVAFFTQQRVAAIAAPEGPDRTLLRKMDNVFVIRIARPDDIRLSFF